MIVLEIIRQTIKKKGGDFMLNAVKETNYFELNRLPEIHIDADVLPHQQAHYWYGGEMATIKFNGYIFCLEALGDVYARLYQRSDLNEPLEHIGDKHNHGALGNTLRHYIETDAELEQLIEGTHPTYTLELEDNNWWECFVIDPDGVWYDLMWNLDSTLLSEAIEEVLIGLVEGVHVNDVFVQVDSSLGLNPQELSANALCMSSH